MYTTIEEKSKWTEVCAKDDDDCTGKRLVKIYWVPKPVFFGKYLSEKKSSPFLVEKVFAPLFLVEESDLLIFPNICPNNFCKTQNYFIAQLSLFLK